MNIFNSRDFQILHISKTEISSIEFVNNFLFPTLTGITAVSDSISGASFGRSSKKIKQIIYEKWSFKIDINENRKEIVYNVIEESISGKGLLTNSLNLDDNYKIIASLKQRL